MDDWDNNASSPLLPGNTTSLTTSTTSAGDDVALSSTNRANANSVRIVNSLTTSNVSRFSQRDAERKKTCCTKFCTLMDTWPITFVLASAAVGIAIGVGLSMWVPDDPRTKEAVVLWIGLLGDLFIRSLKCIVLPLVFVSIAISVMDMLSLGEAGRVVGTTIGLYVVTTICAALIGIFSSLIFSGFYTPQDDAIDEAAMSNVRLGCTVDASDQPNSYLTEQEDGSVVCVASSGDMSQAPADMADNTLFRMEDVNGYFQKADSELAKLSLSESIYNGLFMQLIDDNMIGMFYNNNFLGVVILGCGFGVALTRLAKEMPPDVNWDRILTIQILEELMEIFMLFIHWIIKCTPFAIISLIAKAIGAQNDVGQVFQQLGYLLAAIVVGLIGQFTLVYCGLYVFFLRKNPLKYLKCGIPAFTMAFACSSSAATLPVSIDCALNSGQVTEGIARFSLPLGATINMDGSSIQIICSCIWLAYLNGIVPTAADYLLLFFCASLGSMGAAPVPSAGLVLILTSYSTTFGSSGGGTPSGFAFLVAIDWLVDRLATMFNMGGDLTVTAIVSDRVGKDLAEHNLGEETENGDGLEKADKSC